MAHQSSINDLNDKSEDVSNDIYSVQNLDIYSQAINPNR